MSRPLLTRRTALIGIGAGLLTGCDKLGNDPTAREVLFTGENMQRWLQRSLMNRNALAPEYRRDQMSPIFRTNGSRTADTPDYQALLANNFADWRLVVDGMVARPLSLSLEQLRAMPARTQVTRHDCVEGWSAIGEWHGPPLKLLLDQAGLRRDARYIVFHCADRIGGVPYYETIDLVDAFHPQTILAWAMNRRPLSVGHGAPLRLRVERQLGYKHAKFVMRIQAVAHLDDIGRGKGGFWEDVADYDWYAGI
jgi:DMSO/TMAO reductase YedYZ molybdopterin-dependent catalytic subunit